MVDYAVVDTLSKSTVHFTRINNPAIGFIEEYLYI
jgi:hypothetical protein